MGTQTWKCPYCHSVNVQSEYNLNVRDFRLFDSAAGRQRFRVVDMVCGNPKCRQLSLRCGIGGAWNDDRVEMKGAPKHVWSLLPRSTAFPLPEYVPAPLRADYEEACLIADLNPKASATLSRRCLQGMIRDFFGISRGTLYKEIEAIRELVDQSVWEAIDAIRTIGNIGAHMEKDINVIVDVDSSEAKLLIELIE